MDTPPFLKLMIQHLRETGISQERILEMNFESMSFLGMDARDFYEYVKVRILPDKRMYPTKLLSV